MLSLCKSLSTGQCNIIGSPNSYPVDSNLSGGQRYPAFEQLGLVDKTVLGKPIILCYPLDSDLSSGQGYTAFEQLGPGLNVTNNLPLSKTTPLKKYNTIIFSLKNICQGENHFNINSCYIETPSLKERFVANNMTKFFLSTSLQMS